MSTRSGKRIHGSIHENTVENISELKEKKRKNYVRYPSEEDITLRSTRKSQRNMLKEQNILPRESECTNYDNKNPCLTRQSTKIQAIESIENVEPVDDRKDDKKSKSSRKKKTLANDNDICKPLVQTPTKKKTNKKKNKQKSSFAAVEDVETVAHNNVSVDAFHSAAGSLVNCNEAELETKNLPPKIISNGTDTSLEGIMPIKQTNRKTKSFSETSCYESVNCNMTSTNHGKEKSYANDINNETIEKQYTSSLINSPDTSKTLPKNKKRSKINNSMNVDLPTLSLESIDHEKASDSLVPNTKRESSAKKKSKSSNDNINQPETNLNATFNTEYLDNINNQSDITVANENMESKKDRKRKSSIRNINLDTTYDKRHSNQSIEQTDGQNNAESKKSKQSRRSSNHLLDQGDKLTNLNRTYNKSLNTEDVPISHNATYEKATRCDINVETETETKLKLDFTFDKSQKKDTSYDSSILSLDITSDLSFETSKRNSRASITSDDSRAENIVNSTPVLIESSMDESQNNIGTNTVTKTPLRKCATLTKTKNSTTPSNHKRYNNVTAPLDIADNMNDEVNTSQVFEDACLETLKPHKHSGTYTEIKVTRASLSNDNSCRERQVNALLTPLKREGTYTEIRSANTPFKREGTYTEINSKVSLKKIEDDISLSSEQYGAFREVKLATTSINREGTFTKEDSPNNVSLMGSPKRKMSINKTPTRRKSLPSPGCTPFPLSKSAAKEKSILNITRSIEKSPGRSSSAGVVPKATKVMFCSPVNYPVVVTQMKGKVIKSNMKGSNKSFVFDSDNDSASASVRPSRKRSHTQSEAEEGGSRKRAYHQRQSVDRLSRPRTASASATLQHKPKSEASQVTKVKGRVARTKLPNFTALHQKEFAKMESLNECQQRKAKRARQLLTPTAPITVLERVSPKDTRPDASSAQSKKTETPKKYLIPTDSSKAYTRFGFKLNLDVNPFSVPAKAPEVKPDDCILPLRRQATLPSLIGTTSVRKNTAKQTIMRENTVTEKQDVLRKKNRITIKGVRTNRRFELQMKMRQC